MWAAMLISSGSMGPARRRMFLVDTCVISEARKSRRADPGVVAFWADVARLQTPLFLASVTIGALRRGVELIRHRGDHQQT